MQDHDDYRPTQPLTPYGASAYHLLLNHQNSTHDLNKGIPSASSGMYGPGTAAMQGAGPQHHQPGQAAAVSMVQQQQLSHRPVVINSMPPRPQPQMISITRTPMGNVPQPTPQAQQQYSHVQNVMLQSHPNIHPQSMPAQPPMFVSPFIMANRNSGYQHQPFIVTHPYSYPPQPTSGPTYYQMPSCSPVVNNMPESQPPPTSKRKILTIINPNTGEDILKNMLKENEHKDVVSRSGGSDVAMKFASQVAATVAAKDSNAHRLSEDGGQPQLGHAPQNMSIENSSSEPVDCEISSVELCNEPYVEEIANSHETPSLSYSDKDSIDVISISDNIAIIPDIKPDVEVCLVNHEEILMPEESYSVVSEVKEEEVELKPIVDTPVDVVQVEDDTNCVISEQETQVVDDSSINAIQQQDDSVETLSASPSSESNKFSDTSISSFNALKTLSEKTLTEGKKGKKNKKKDINKKGESKEGSEMDAFYIAGDSAPNRGSPSAPSTLPIAEAEPAPEEIFVTEPEVVYDEETVVAAVTVDVPEEVVVTTAAAAVVVEDADSGDVDPLLNSIPIVNDEEMVEDDVPVEMEILDEILSTEEEIVEKKEDLESPPQEAPKVMLKYNYKEDQWSPVNPEGKKQYDRDFLMKLQTQPMSMKKPLNLPNLEVIKDKAQVHKLNDMTRLPPPMPIPPRGVNNAYDPFVPQYVRSGTHRLPHPGMRRSQQGREKPKKIIEFSKSLTQAVKLHESENAWKPAIQTSRAEQDAQEDQMSQEIFRRVRGILNKLTPQKFQTLLDQVKELEINTEERLNGVIDLVFEKAIDEPNFSVPYAQMCNQLNAIWVPCADKEVQQVNFRKLLLTKCQKEFEQDTKDELKKKLKLLEIKECDSEEKKKSLEIEIAEEDRKNRRRQLGNIRFIGELFKLGILIEHIMHDCINKLLSHCDEDSLECLCRLLSTIGKKLDSRNDNDSTVEFEAKKDVMNNYFNDMQKIVDRRQTSSRVRFMLQDLIELKKRHWVPRRDENNPKTIDQIHEEAEKEAYEQQQMLQNMPYTSKRQPEDNRRKSSNQGRNPDYDGWQSTNRTGKSSFNQSFDPMKLKGLARQTEVENIQLCPSARGFGSWGRGSSGGYKPSPEPETRLPPTVLSNRYMPLADSNTPNLETRRGSQSRSAASSRESSRGRSNQMSPLIRKTPSASKEYENALEAASRIVRPVQSAERKIPEPPKVPEPAKSVNGKEVSSDNANALKGKELSSDEMAKKTKPLMDEFLHNNDSEEAVHCIRELASPSTVHMFISEAINHVLERSSQTRCMLGRLLLNLVKSKIINMTQYNKGLQSVLEIVDDYALDIPKIWEYLGEIIEPMVEATSPSSLRFLAETLKPCMPSASAGKLVSAVLHCAAKTCGTIKVAELWKESGLEWSVFVAQADVAEFLASEKLEFTVCPTDVQSNAAHKTTLSIEEIKKKLDYYMTNSKSNEDILDWIESHITEKQMTEPSFVRALVTSVFESVIVGSGEMCLYSVEKFKECVPLLSKYVSNESLQLQALYAIQALLVRLLQPKGILKSIFDNLYDDEIIMEEAFKQWEKSTDPAEQVGRGVALASVSGFLTWLREADDESE